MSKAKDDYYEFKKEADLHHEGLCDRSYEYIKELEEHNKEMLEYLIEIFTNDIGHKYIWPTVDAKVIIEKVTGKTIEEVLK